jgi:hypothetical protein
MNKACSSWTGTAGEESSVRTLAPEPDPEVLLRCVCGDK